MWGRCGGTVGRYRPNGQVRVGVRGERRTGSVLPSCFWGGEPEGGEEQVGSGDQGGVVVPDEPGTARLDVPNQWELVFRLPLTSMGRLATTLYPPYWREMVGRPIGAALPTSVYAEA